MAEYERLRLEAADLPALAQNDPVGDPLRVEAKIALLEGLAASDQLELYNMSTRMPGSFYLSFVFGAAPSRFGWRPHA